MDHPANPFTVLPRRLRQLRAIGALAGVLAIAPLWALARPAPLRRAIAVLAWALLLRGFAVRVRCHGARPAKGALIVANHISWLDIAVLGRICDAGFIAKAEVGRWPVIGPLARRLGCLFIEREVRSALPGVIARMDGYAPRSGLILFPEGTTSEGTALLPFRSSLFAAAGERWAAVQPVTLSYRRRDGAALSHAGRRRIAWLGDDALLPHALALAGAGGAAIDLWFEAPVAPGPRKVVAEACRASIAARLAAIDAGDQAATLKRAA